MMVSEYMHSKGMAKGRDLSANISRPDNPNGFSIKFPADIVQIFFSSMRFHEGVKIGNIFVIAEKQRHDMLCNCSGIYPRGITDSDTPLRTLLNIDIVITGTSLNQIQMWCSIEKLCIYSGVLRYYNLGIFQKARGILR